LPLGRFAQKLLLYIGKYFDIKKLFGPRHCECFKAEFCVKCLLFMLTYKKNIQKKVQVCGWDGARKNASRNS